jgi:hypothetical protein
VEVARARPAVCRRPRTSGTWTSSSVCSATRSRIDNPTRKRRKPKLPGRLEADGGDLFAERWLFKHAGQYVTAVEEVERRNEDAPGRFDSWNSKKRAWKHEETLAQAVYAIAPSGEPGIVGDDQGGQGSSGRFSGPRSRAR